MQPRNIIEKIWDAHVVKQVEGHPAIFAIDFQLLHEVTSPQAFAMLDERGLKVKHPNRHIATLDHSTPTTKDRSVIYDLSARKQVNTLRENVKGHGVELFDFDSGHQGIVHVIGPELGVTQPGRTIVCGDSHTSTHGAFGAMAFGVGTTEVGLVMATGCLLREKPKTMKVEFRGEFKPGVFAKDAILALIGVIGIGGANGHVIEYTGEAIRAMNMEERMTVCNMSIECGARAGLVGPDETTFEYLKGRKYSPKNWDEAVEKWADFASDEGCSYDREIVIDLSDLDPMTTWGTNPGQAMQVTEVVPEDCDYAQLTSGQAIEGVPVQWAFLGSCTNSRISDLRIAADVLKGKKVHADVTFYVVPGSEAVKAQAEAEGLDAIFEAAGAEWRQPGCSMCIAMNGDAVPEGERCISTSNRNFVGRQGKGSITHLASPAMVAASAIAGHITNPTPYFL